MQTIKKSYPVVAGRAYCPDCHEEPHAVKDCPVSWPREKVLNAYLQARVVLTRIESGNIRVIAPDYVRIEIENALHPSE